MRALICGGGVGGLSLAVALQRSGYKVTVFERHRELRTTGHGLNLWPNAVRCIYKLGMKDIFDLISIAIDHYTTIDTNNEILHTKDIKHWNEKYGAPSTGVKRLALIEMLARYTGFENIKFNHKLIDYEDKGDKVRCYFNNGKMIEGDLLIGADGIHSKVRQIMQGKIDYHLHSFHAYRWRGIVSIQDITFDPMANLQVYGGDAFFGTLGVGDGKAYWYASGPGLNDRKSFEECYMSWWKTHVPQTIEATSDNDIMQTKLEDLATLPKRWTVGRVTLLGDAAHPMMPDMAQGASQTFVDSYVLGQCLKEATHQTIHKCLKKYESIRRPTAEHVVDVSRRSARMRRKYPLVERYENEVESFSN